MDLIFISLFASLLWIVAFVFYMHTSKQHDRIENEIERVHQLLREQE